MAENKSLRQVFQLIQLDKGRAGWKKEIQCNGRERSCRRSQAEYKRMKTAKWKITLMKQQNSLVNTIVLGCIGFS